MPWGCSTVEMSLSLPVSSNSRAWEWEENWWHETFGVSKTSRISIRTRPPSLSRLTVLCSSSSRLRNKIARPRHTRPCAAKRWRGAGVRRRSGRCARSSGVGNLSGGRGGWSGLTPWRVDFARGACHGLRAGHLQEEGGPGTCHGVIPPQRDHLQIQGRPSPRRGEARGPAMG